MPEELMRRDGKSNAGCIGLNCVRWFRSHAEEAGEVGMNDIGSQGLELGKDSMECLLHQSAYEPRRFENVHPRVIRPKPAPEVLDDYRCWLSTP